MPGVDPRPADVLVVGRAANRRFSGENQILFRVIQVWTRRSCWTS